MTHEAISYDHDARPTDLLYTSGSTTSIVAGYHYPYDFDSDVTDLYSYTDTSDTGCESGGYLEVGGTGSASYTTGNPSACFSTAGMGTSASAGTVT